MQTKIIIKTNIQSELLTKQGLIHNAEFQFDNDTESFQKYKEILKILHSNNMNCIVKNRPDKMILNIISMEFNMCNRKHIPKIKT
jgi:hypothetical protein